MQTSQSKVALHIVTKADLRARAELPWPDPDQIATFTPEKRSAFLSNPLSRSEDEPIQILAGKNERVVGKLDLLAGEVIVRGEALPMTWTSGYVVPEEHRNSLAAVAIVVKAQKICPVIGACGVSKLSLPIFQSLKWVDFAETRMVFLRRSRAVIEKRLGTNALSRGVAAVADAALYGAGALLRAKAAGARRGLHVHQAVRAESDFDVAVSRDQTPVRLHRSAAWLNWLLEESFDADPSRRDGLFYVRDITGRVLGYFLVKMKLHASASHRGYRDVRLASVSDWASFDASQLSEAEIVALAAEQLLAWSADAIEVCTGDAVIQRSLRRLAFARVDFQHTLLRPPAAAQGEPVHAWRLRPAEGDNFFM